MNIDATTGCDGQDAEESHFRSGYEFENIPEKIVRTQFLQGLILS